MAKLNKKQLKVFTDNMDALLETVPHMMASYSEYNGMYTVTGLNMKKCEIDPTDYVGEFNTETNQFDPNLIYFGFEAVVRELLEKAGIG